MGKTQRSFNDTVVFEHEEDANAKRILLVDNVGNVLGSLPIQHKSVAGQLLVDYHSDDAATRIGASQTRFFPSASDWFDLGEITAGGFVGFQLSVADKTAATDGGYVDVYWSRDGVNTNYAAGDHMFSFTAVGLNLINSYFVSRRERYVRIAYRNGAIAHGSSYPNICTVTAVALPHTVTSLMKVVNSQEEQIPTKGSDKVGEGPISEYPFMMAGLDTANGIVAWLTLDGSSRLFVTGNATTYASGNPLLVAERGASSATLANVAEANASTQLAASSTTRRRFIVHNDTANILYLKFGSSASATSYTRKLAAAEHYEMDLPHYTGAIHGFSPGTGGTWRVTTY
jgi:hypothetical protein